MIFKRNLFSESTLSNLGFFHNPMEPLHSSKGPEFMWDGSKFEIGERAYRVWQVGFTGSMFMQLLIKVVLEENIIQIYSVAGESINRCFKMDLYYGKCETEKDFKRIMKMINMWDVTYKNRVANKSKASQMNFNNITQEF